MSIFPYNAVKEEVPKISEETDLTNHHLSRYVIISRFRPFQSCPLILLLYL